MLSSLSARRARLTPIFATLAILVGCEMGDSPTAPADAPVVMLGRIASVSATSPAGGAAPAPSLTSPSSPLAGIEVSVEGGTATDVTDDSGNFRLEIEGGAEEIRLRFRRGHLDVRMSLSGLPAGAVIQLEIDLDDSSATVVSKRESRDDEFEGVATLVAIEGEAPARTLHVDLVDGSRTDRVAIVEGLTLFDNEGDILTFADLHAALDNGSRVVEIEGEGERQDDGSTVAASVKAETDDHGGDDDSDDDSDDSGMESPDEFEGTATLVSIEGEEPARTLRVELARVSGTVLVDIAEGVTLFDNEGDILGFADLLAALDRGDLVIEIEGEGRMQDDGAFAAASVKVETSQDLGGATLPDDSLPGDSIPDDSLPGDSIPDDLPGDSIPGDDTPGTEGPAEFAGVATLVSLEGVPSSRTLRVELTGLTGTVLVDIDEGVTVFDTEGDVLGFEGLLLALDHSDLTVDIEGQGEARDDGSIAAASVKVETTQTP